MNVHEYESGQPVQESGFRILGDTAPESEKQPTVGRPRRRREAAKAGDRPKACATKTAQPPPPPAATTLAQLPSLDQAATLLRTVVRRRPWLSLAVGLTVGLAMAGAVSSRAGRTILVSCGRYALRRLFRDRIE